MTKQEKIKEAYGDYYGECNPFIDADGWFDKNAFYNNSLSIRYSNMNELFVHKGDFMRPKKLHGIENNNGWIKIESEEDLPNGEYTLYHVISKNDIYCNKPKNQGIEEFWGNDTEKKEYWLKEFTHYQQIFKPDLPLY